MADTTEGAQELEIVFAHCSVAFGQGAGKIGISAHGVGRLLQVYRPILTHHAKNWATESGRILGYAESLGRVSAHLAIGAGKLEIDPESVTEATALASRGIFCLKNQ